MLVTKEQQEAWLDSYIKEGHNFDECVGFIDGIEKALNYVQEKMKPQDSSNATSQKFATLAKKNKCIFVT